MIRKVTRRAEHEFMNTHYPPINILVTALNRLRTGSLIPSNPQKFPTSLAHQYSFPQVRHHVERSRFPEGTNS